MKIRMLFSIGLTVLSAGCSSNPQLMSSQVERALGDSVLHTLRDVRAMTYWSSSFGHGLKIEVRAPGVPGEYAPDLVSEMDGAAMVFASIARTDLSTRWDFVEVQYSIEYGEMPPGSKQVVGVVDVLIQRETMMKLNSQHLPASAYPHYWVLINGFKDQPGSNELLEWR